MSSNKTLILTLVCVVSGIGDAAQVLGIFPMISKSHYILGNALLRGLAEAGHNVTMISPFEEKNPPKGGSYRDVVITGLLESEQFTINFLSGQSKIDKFLKIVDILFNANDFILGHEHVKKLLKSDEKFDVVIVEQFAHDAMKIFGHIYNAPVIIFSTIDSAMWVNKILGNPSPISYIPQMQTNGTPYMTFTQRIINLFTFLGLQVLEWLFYFPEQNRILKKHFPNSPDIYDLFYNVSLVLLNSHVSLYQPVPLVPNVVQIGGYHVAPPKQLPKDLQEYLDNAREGVVYFSLGTNLKSKNLSPFKRDIFLTALGKLKEKVLWKFEDEELPGKPPNVKIAKWFPQQDVLAHPNVKLFVTHCGLLSVTETVYHGVPILAIPFFGDQPMNAKLAVSGGYALSLPFEDPSFSERKLSGLLQELLTNPKYKDNARKRSQLFRDRPMKPMDTAVYWVEHVIRNKGADHLKVAGAGFPWYKYHSLDVIGFVAVIISLVVYVFYVSVRTVLRCCEICGKVKSKSKKD